MKKIITFLLLTVICFADNFGAMNFMEQNENTNKGDEKVVYKDMLSYLSLSNDSSQFLVLGSLYATGSKIKDSTGAIIKQDIFLSEKYLLKSAEMGNIHALTVLSGFIMFDKKMNTLDPKFIRVEGFLKKAYKLGDTSAGILLSNIYITTGKYDKGLQKLIECADKKDSDAQFALALLFKDGMKNSEGKVIIDKNMKTAEAYLNKACTNEHKSTKVSEYCSDGKTVITTTK